MNRLSSPTLKHYVARYKMDKALLEKHPENKELLKKRIERHKQDIVDYVTSERFEIQLNYLNLQKCGFIGDINYGCKRN